jgi:hypothetical protein
MRRLFGVGLGRLVIASPVRGWPRAHWSTESWSAGPALDLGQQRVGQPVRLAELVGRVRHLSEHRSRCPRARRKCAACLGLASDEP